MSFTPPRPWQQYQEDAAAYFRSVGLSADVDVRLIGVRTSHDVDVAVRFNRAGMSHLWIVECKAQSRAVSKDRPLLLRQIVDDLGADRGILLCEAGFQVGAREAVHSSNIVAMSLTELRTSASEEVLDFALDSLTQRARRAIERFVALSVNTRKGRLSSSRLPKLAPGAPISDPVTLLGQLSVVRAGIERAKDRTFPSPIAVDSGGQVVRAGRADFVRLAGIELARLEAVVETLIRPDS